MIRIEMTDVLVGLDGTPMRDPTGEEQTKNKVVANILSQTKGDALKLYDLAVRFWSGTPFEIDESDFKLVRETIDKSELWPIAKAPILRSLDEAKETSEKASRPVAYMPERE